MIMIIQFNNIRFPTDLFWQSFHLSNNSDDYNDKFMTRRFSSDDDCLYEKH